MNDMTVPITDDDRVIGAANECLIACDGNPARAATAFVQKALNDWSLLYAWGRLFLREVKQRNDGAIGRIHPAHDGLANCADAPSHHGDDDGLRMCADHGQWAIAASSPTEREGAGHVSRAEDGQLFTASPSLTNEDDAGQSGNAEGQTSFAGASSTNEGDEGQNLCVDADHRPFAPSLSPNRGGKGHHVSAREGHSTGVAPIREPSNLQRAAAKAQFAASARTIFDTRKVCGRSVGDIRFREIPALIDESVIDATILRQIQRRGGANVAPDARIREVIKESDLAEMITKAEGIADVA